jgi:AbrB-like transcriptional regulator
MIATRRKRSGFAQLSEPKPPTVDREVPVASLSTPLSGDKLLEYLLSSTGETKSQKAISCGYYFVNSKNQKIAQTTKFLEAVLLANNMDLGDNDSRSGRLPSHLVRVTDGGHILVGRSYVREYGYNKGDTFKISASTAGILLEPVS